MATGRLVAVLAVLSVWACTRDHVQRGTNLYGKGRYVEAAEVFERTEERLPSLDPSEQARYGLYRGLTLLVLGDVAGSQRWLGYARQVEARAPGSLGPERFGLLERGTFELQNRMRQSAPRRAAPAPRPHDPPPASQSARQPPPE